MQTLLRCLTAMALLAVAAQAQPTSGVSPSTDMLRDLGFPGILLYLASRDLGPIVMRKMRGPGGDRVAAAVMDNSLKNLEEKFDDHVKEDRDNFELINRTLMEISKGQARIQGILENGLRKPQ